MGKWTKKTVLQSGWNGLKPDATLNDGLSQTVLVMCDQGKICSLRLRCWLFVSTWKLSFYYSPMFIFHCCDKSENWQSKCHVLPAHHAYRFGWRLIYYYISILALVWASLQGNFEFAFFKSSDCHWLPVRPNRHKGRIALSSLPGSVRIILSFHRRPHQPSNWLFMTESCCFISIRADNYII